MSGWFKVSNSIYDDPKMLGLSDSARVSWINLLAFCSKHETDGDVITAAFPIVFRKKKDRDELESAGLVEPTPDGVRIVKYLAHQRSKAEIEADRAAARDRQRRSRGRDVTA